MKEKTISLLNEKYSENIGFIGSDRSTYILYVNEIDDVKIIESDIKELIDSNIIADFSIFYLNNSKQYKVVFSIPYGWKDGIEKR